MEQLAKVGDLCPNEGCLDYQKLQAIQSKPNIIRAGKTRKGVQRYECKTCGKSFTETKGFTRSVQTKTRFSKRWLCWQKAVASAA